MLRLTYPALRGQRIDPPERARGSRAPALTFTPEDTRLVRATLRNAATKYGGFDVLAAAMGVPVSTLYHVNKRRPSSILTIRLAAANGVTIGAMLPGRLETLPAASPAPSGLRRGAA
jgi:hypothetical protein